MGRNLLLVVAGVLVLVTLALLIDDRPQSTRPAATSSAIDSAAEAEAPAAPTAVSADVKASAGSDEDGDPLSSIEIPTIAADVAYFDGWQTPAAAQARQRIIAAGPEVLPEVVAALGAVSDVVAGIDISRADSDRDRIEALLMKQNHLLYTVAGIGGDAAVAAILDTSASMSPDSPLRGSIYAALDVMGAAADADQHALDVIGSADSRSIELATALARFWLGTPAAAGTNLAEHFDADSSQVRALAFKLAVNLDRDDEVRPYLLREVSAMRYAQPGNKQTLLALAGIESRAQLQARLDALRLRPSVKEAARTYSDFLAADEAERDGMLASLLNSSESELWALAVQHMLETGRVDLLGKHQLLYVPRDPMLDYDARIPGFSRMTRTQRLTYLDANELDRLEQAAASMPEIGYGPGVQRVLRRLGYSATRSGPDIVLTVQGS